MNVFNYETVKWVAEAANREKIPVIIQLYPGFDKYIALKHVADFAKNFAVQSDVPIAVHLDHSAGYEIAVGGIKAGFPSVMVDGSALPYEENVEVTAAVVRTANVFNVDVEAELGHVGSGANLDDIVNADNYTNVDQAVEFVQRTGCGSLAVAVGNAHGAYVKVRIWTLTASPRCTRRCRYRWFCTAVPIFPHEQLQESVRLGMSKFNIATEYFRAIYKSIAAQVDKEAKDGNFMALLDASSRGCHRFCPRQDEASQSQQVLL